MAAVAIPVEGEERFELEGELEGDERGPAGRGAASVGLASRRGGGGDPPVGPAEGAGALGGARPRPGAGTRVHLWGLPRLGAGSGGAPRVELVELPGVGRFPAGA